MGKITEMLPKMKRFIKEKTQWLWTHKASIGLAFIIIVMSLVVFIYADIVANCLQKTISLISNGMLSIYQNILPVYEKTPFVFWIKIITVVIVAIATLRAYLKIKEKRNIFLKIFKSIQQKYSAMQTQITKNLIDKNRVILVFFAALGSAFIAWGEYSLFFSHTTPNPWEHLINNTRVWSLATAIISLPIALVLWIFRDNNQLKQIENQRKDVNLKDFQKVSEWASGVNLIEDKKTTTGNDYKAKTVNTETYVTDNNLGKKEGAEALQIAAIYQLKPYINGEYGEYFRMPAFQLIKTMWAKLIEKYDEKEKLNKLPLAIAISTVTGETIKKMAKDFPNELQGINLSKIILPAVNWSEVSLLRAILRGADLRGAILRGADLLMADLREADLSGANLWRIDLRGAILQGADLRGAYLRGADLRGAILRGAILRGAKLQGADLREAGLSRAKLRGAILQGADLRGANLSGAELINIEYDSETDFSGATTDDDTLVELQDESRNILEEETLDLRRQLRDENRLELPAWMYEFVQKPVDK